MSTFTIKLVLKKKEPIAVQVYAVPRVGECVEIDGIVCTVIKVKHVNTYTGSTYMDILVFCDVVE
jgi:hypothetical protein